MTDKIKFVTAVEYETYDGMDQKYFSYVEDEAHNYLSGVRPSGTHPLSTTSRLHTVPVLEWINRTLLPIDQRTHPDIRHPNNYEVTVEYYAFSKEVERKMKWPISHLHKTNEKLWAEIDPLKRERDQARKEIDEFKSMSLWARFKFLVTGKVD